jgi:hypothetical protein
METKRFGMGAHRRNDKFHAAYADCRSAGILRDGTAAGKTVQAVIWICRFKEFGYICVAIYRIGWYIII